ncbi:hypothetical protein H9P43_003430 [Blastocladiella emersonii ATCC 22665]|nr:hypothetical protein H9P43_003430 [Blastocladiella emersonii ATCC 22665]
MGKARKKGAAPAVPDLVRIEAAEPIAVAVHEALRVADAKAPAYHYGYRANASQDSLFDDAGVLDALDDADAAIAATLYGGYNASQMYTWLGAAAMVGVTPPTASSTILAELTSDAAKDRWYKMYKNMRPEPLPSAIEAAKAAGRNPPPPRDVVPHAFAMANSLYFHLRRSGVDQSLILRGENGSGKTLQADLILQQLCNISGNSKRDERVHRRVLAAQTVLNAFGCAKTTSGADSSRFGSYHEVQFNERGKLVGMQLIAYGLERNRVLRQRLSERNYHAFYYLLAGADPELRQELGLNGAVFPYLSFGASMPVQGVDDAGRFAALQDAMRAVGISKRNQYQIWKLLAAVLHLGNIRFAVDKFNEQESCVVANPDALQFVAGLLEVDPDFLANALTSKTALVGRDLVTQLLTVELANDHRDALAKVLYTVLFTWLIEQMNKKLSVEDDMANFIALVDFPSAPAPAASADNDTSTRAGAKAAAAAAAAEASADVSKVAFAYANERIDAFVNKRVFEYGNAELRQEGMVVHDTKYPKPAAAEKAFLAAATAAAAAETDAFPGDFINLFRGGNGQGGSRAPLFHELFSESIISMEAFEKNSATVVRGQSLMRRKPSIKRANSRGRAGSTSGSLRRTGSSATAVGPNGRSGKDANGGVKPESEAGVFMEQLDALIDALENTHAKFLFCVRPNADHSTSFDLKLVRAQVHDLRLGLVLAHVVRRGGGYTLRFTHAAFVEKYGHLYDLAEAGDDPRAKCALFKQTKGMADAEMHVGASLVILRDDAWLHLENVVRKREHDAKRRSKKTPLGPGGIPLARDRPLFSPNGDARTEYSGENDSVYSEGDFGDDGFGSEWDGDSMYGESVADDMATNYELNERNVRAHDAITRGVNAALDLKNEGNGAGIAASHAPDHDDGYAMTSERRRWIRIVWFLTWWIPTPFLRWCGGMQRADIRMAWREKTAICILIAFACAVQLFFIIGFGRIICPRQNIFNLNELFYKKSQDESFVAMYGAIYDLSDFTKEGYHSYDMLKVYAGYDVTAGFPRTPAYYCEYARDAAPDSPPLYTERSNANGTFIQLRHREMYDRDSFGAQRRVDWRLRSNIKAMVGWDPTDILTLSSGASSAANRAMFSIKGRVYDLQPYINSNLGLKFLPGDIVTLLQQNRGKDMTEVSEFMAAWNSNKKLRDCMNNLFVVGVVDYRKSGRCMFTNYILLAFSIMLAAVIGGKFLAALQLSSSGTPEEHDKFVLLQVPCYTEGEDSLRRTIDSLSTLRYDDKRKLLFIVCDGNIMGSGNDRPTPRIVLDILGVDPMLDPEPLSFQSVGDGMKQHNMGKIYSGLYECQGHLVPYIVVVKVGKPSEASRPGNRGKRDSQMILMRFLNKVMFDAPMSPLELELYHQIKNVIGVNPSFYEYVLMVDADTVVMPDSLSRLVSVMIRDTSVMGCCGETRLSNEKDTWATMIQVYEYFISHHLAKAFESLFGCVTCLPGCFSMYRIRSPNKNSPLLVSNEMIHDYGDCNVDTLHKKNLLHLGEDRFLTTLLLKNFPSHRTVFTADAKCDTLAPDQWDVLLSQRRRWINSTIHNLVELLKIRQLCGFCIFSMRFITLVDLSATLIQPAIVAYLGYLIYLIVDSVQRNDTNNFPMISIILLGVIYGLQAIIFLIKREWQHVGWMIVYIFAIPIFSFMIPVYSFWKQDDVSWGSTRIVAGENGKKVAVAAEVAEKFDLAVIPHRTWSEHEAEMMMGMEHAIDEFGNELSPRDMHQQQYAGSMYDDPLGSAAMKMAMAIPLPADDMRSERSGYSYRGTPASASLGFGGPSPVGMGGMGAVDLKRSNSAHTAISAFSVGQYYGGPTTPSPLPSIPAAYGGPSPLGGMAGFPTDEEIYHEVRRILSTADLMTITKKAVRDELSALFNVDLSPRRDFINQCINEILANGI